MEILTEFDELQAALAKVKMDESVFVYHKGRLINENAYNKVQKILNAPEMISGHKYLYELDMDQLTNEDIEKIDKLYDLGVQRGFIVDDLTDWDAEDSEEEVEDDIEVAVEQPATQRQPQNTLFKAKIPCWTVIYSATKDGDIKTGEAYSNAVSMSAAKADVNAKLSQCGYDNVTILAIENCMNAPTSPITTRADFQMSEADDAGDDSSSDDSSDDASDDSDDSSSDEGSDDSDDSFDFGDEGSSDEGSDEEDSGDEGSDEKSDDEESDDEDSSDEDSDDEKSDDEKSDDEKSDKDDSDEESDNEDDEESDELDASKKAELRDSYRKTFRNTLIKCKFDTSFNDLTLEQKVKFFTELVKAWDEDIEPQEFMTDKEIEQLDNVVAYKNDEGSDEESDDEESDEEFDFGDEESDEEESDEEESDEESDEEESDEEESDEEESDEESDEEE